MDSPRRYHWYRLCGGFSLALLGLISLAGIVFQGDEWSTSTAIYLVLGIIGCVIMAEAALQLIRPNRSSD